MHIEQPFKPGIVGERRTTREELGHNIDQWANIAQKMLPADVGFIMIMFPRDAAPHEMNFVTGNGAQGQIQARLKAVASELRTPILVRG